MSKFFEDLMASVQQMDEIVKGRREPSRSIAVPESDVKGIRAKTGLSQERFARLVDVPVTTLRNWEQGRREPRGPSRALLRAIGNDPQAVLSALAPNQQELQRAASKGRKSG